MQVLDGRKLAMKLQSELKGKLKGKGSFDAFLIGQDPASILYLRKKAEMAESLGVAFNLHKYTVKDTSEKVLKKIESLNNDPKVAGVMVQLPLPTGFNAERIVNAIDPAKDADGLTDANIASGKVLPATAEGVIQLMKHYKISWRGKRVILIGFTRLLNVPLSVYLATTGAHVEILQEHTKSFGDLKMADIIITAAGQANLVKAKDVKKGVVVLDAGTNQYKGKLVGDVDYESVSKKALAITPVPGGIGPMTVVSLFVNLANLSKNFGKSHK